MFPHSFLSSWQQNTHGFLIALELRILIGNAKLHDHFESRSNGLITSTLDPSFLYWLTLVLIEAGRLSFSRRSLLFSSSIFPSKSSKPAILRPPIMSDADYIDLASVMVPVLWGKCNLSRLLSEFRDLSSSSSGFTFAMMFVDFSSWKPASAQLALHF